jgi:DNA modification methylase
MRSEQVAISTLSTDPANVRTHPERNLSDIAASLKRFGQQKPIVVDADGVVVAGNGTLEAARSLGWDKIAVVKTKLAGADRTAYAIADNRTAEFAEWDDTALAAQLDALRAEDLDAVLAAGFTEKEIDTLLAQTAPPIEEDEVPEPPSDPVTKPGDVWTLGRHRLGCFDATERASYAALLHDIRPELVVTDPPYGVAYQDHGGKRLKGDLTQASVPVSIACMVDVIDDDARLYVFGGTDQFAMMDRVFTHHLEMRPRPIVWVKDSFVLRHNGYHSQYEMVFHGWKGSGGGPRFWYGDRKQSDVWLSGRDRNHLHPTEKPVALCAVPIRNSSKVNGCVLDPFGGSGAILMAAETTDRSCMSMELAPEYCDVIVERWQNLTGEKATRESEAVAC